jgi:hypothetical protein
MWQHQVVLAKFREDDSGISYVNKNNPPQFEQVYLMPTDLFDEMGKPEIITLAVVVGDRLNP